MFTKLMWSSVGRVTQVVLPRGSRTEPPQDKNAEDHCQRAGTRGDKNRTATSRKLTDEPDEDRPEWGTAGQRGAPEACDAAVHAGRGLKLHRRVARREERDARRSYGDERSERDLESRCQRASKERHREHRRHEDEAPKSSLWPEEKEHPSHD